MPIRVVPIALLATLFCASVAAQTTGLIPLNDLGTELYQGFQGGLYPGGKNSLPGAHRQAALQMAAGVLPRNAAGDPDPDGWIVMVAIGMSNATHEFAVFERNEDINVDRNARVVLMDTALGGQSAAIIADPDAAYWAIVEQRLAAMGLTVAQVQVAWLKEANANPPDNFPIHAQELRDDLEAVANNLHDRFSNLKLCYVSSRTYGGYATIPLNPEPQAYETGFSVKWLIEDQINGLPNLNFDPSAGPVRSPLLLWGPYLWADGTNPRSDGLIWLRTDFEEDGTHPAPDGELKVAGLLSGFYAMDITARPWWPRQGDDAVLLTFDAEKDATVDQAQPDMNFGLAPRLVTKGGSPSSSVYLGFDTAAEGALAALAKLSLRVRQSGGGSVFGVNNTGWNELTITFSNKPDVGPLIVEMPTSSRDGTTAADVTGQVQPDADGSVSFSMALAASGQKDYHSREAAQAPRLVLVAPCSSSPDSDGDGRTDVCDCAQSDPTLFAKPDEVRNLRWMDGSNLAWDSDEPKSGSATVYDVMSGHLANVSFYGTGPDDVCLSDDLGSLTVADTTPPLVPGEGRFFLVRGDNGCGKGRYQTSFTGLDRLTTTCP